MPFRTALPAAALLATAMTIAGCGAGNVIDPAKTEIAVRYDVEEATGTRVSGVECPDGIAALKGNRFSCQVKALDGRRALAQLEVLNERGDLRMLRLDRP